MVVFVIAFTSWTYIARIVRGETLSLREKEFVEAARSVGASDRRIIFHEILPNLVAPIIVYTSILIPQVILYEAALSFLGVGVQSPTASWGQMISDATGIFDTAWWYMLFPGLALCSPCSRLTSSATPSGCPEPETPKIVRSKRRGLTTRDEHKRDERTQDAT